MGRLFKKRGLVSRMRENRAIEVWDEAVGESVAANARALSVREGVLTVEAKNNIWLNELNLLSHDIIGRINELVGFDAVTELRFRVATGAMEKKKKPDEPPPKVKKPPKVSAAVERDIEEKLSGVTDPELKAALKSFMIRGAKSGVAKKSKSKSKEKGNGIAG